jgi:hypothetical protein
VNTAQQDATIQYYQREKLLQLKCIFNLCKHSEQKRNESEAPECDTYSYGISHNFCKGISRLEVFMGVKIMTIIFWVTALYSFACGYQSFREI